MTDSNELDALVVRLRERLADPERRTDSRPSIFSQRVQSMSLGDLLSTGRGLAQDLLRLVDANRQGAAVPADLEAKALGFAFEMETPATSAEPATATDSAVRATEAAIGLQFPPRLRRLYIEVADGGFGPHTGLLSLAALQDRYLELVDGEVLPRGRTWPRHLLPIVDESMVLLCVDTESEEEGIVAWDPEDLDERVSDRAWQHSFSEEAPSLVAWLSEWLHGPSPQERFDAEFGDQMAETDIQMARESRALIAAMTPEERAAMGLPEEGWEAIVWGGLGWDPDDSNTGR